MRQEISTSKRHSVIIQMVSVITTKEHLAIRYESCRNKVKDSYENETAEGSRYNKMVAFLNEDGCGFHREGACQMEPLIIRRLA